MIGHVGDNLSQVDLPIVQDMRRDVVILEQRPHQLRLLKVVGVVNDDPAFVGARVICVIREIASHVAPP